MPSTTNSFPFRRTTDPLMVPVGLQASKFEVEKEVPGFFKEKGPGSEATSFWVCNANPFWVRLKGSGKGMTEEEEFVAVTETTGWLFPPGFVGAFSTQFPRYMSAMSVKRQGLEPGVGVLEISYGNGV